MHGLIFLQLQRFAQQQGGVATWDALLRDARITRKSYAPVRNYPDEEAFALIDSASRVLQLPVPIILEGFGEFLAPELVRLYGRLVKPEWKTLDFIENTENLIHAAVRVGNPGALPPVLKCVRTTPDELQIMYASGRQLCPLARGIISGLAYHFGEAVLITEDSCMLRGDPFCALQLSLSTVPATQPPKSASADTRIRHESTPYPGMPWPAQAARPAPIAFLKPPLHQDELGRLGDFRVLQLVGQGGMGIVFRAEDTRLNRVVALKVMQPQFSADASMPQRFLREARAMAAIKSDHIVTVYEVGLADELPFLAMEFLEGESLDGYRKKVGRLPIPQALRVARETAVGLAAAHSRGVIHRDIKPANLWLEAPAGRVKILDLGLARAIADATQLSEVGSPLGTPAFMAPEQARGEKVDHRADIFSLGCVLYWMCTDELPFKGTDIHSTITALTTHDPQPPQTLSADLPQALSDLILQLLSKEPAARPTSGKSVADSLGIIERSLAAEGRPSGVSPRN